MAVVFGERPDSRIPRITSAGAIIANGIIGSTGGKAVSAELIGILSVGVALGGLILWMGGWLRDVDRRLARLEGMLEASGLFQKQSGTAGD